MGAHHRVRCIVVALLRRQQTYNLARCEHQTFAKVYSKRGRIHTKLFKSCGGGAKGKVFQKVATPSAVHKVEMHHFLSDDCFHIDCCQWFMLSQKECARFNYGWMDGWGTQQARRTQGPTIKSINTREAELYCVLYVLYYIIVLCIYILSGIGSILQVPSRIRAASRPSIHGGHAMLT
jgi:hypothetical protein